MNDSDASYGCTNGNYYNDFRMLFTGIQVAGPRLTPDSISDGFHAIPPFSSRDPQTPSCYFDVDDYTCVKDAAVMWWDPTAPNNSSARGAWRMPEGGRRYLRDQWPERELSALKKPNDPINGAQGQGQKAIN
jgi:hypothetical protein